MWQWGGGKRWEHYDYDFIKHPRKISALPSPEILYLVPISASERHWRETEKSLEGRWGLGFYGKNLSYEEPEMP